MHPRAATSSLPESASTAARGHARRPKAGSRRRPRAAPPRDLALTAPHVFDVLLARSPCLESLRLGRRRIGRTAERTNDRVSYRGTRSRRSALRPPCSDTQRDDAPTTTKRDLNEDTLVMPSFSPPRRRRDRRRGRRDRPRRGRRDATAQHRSMRHSFAPRERRGPAGSSTSRSPRDSRGSSYHGNERRSSRHVLIRRRGKVGCSARLRHQRRGDMSTTTTSRGGKASSRRLDGASYKAKIVGRSPTDIASYGSRARYALRPITGRLGHGARR